jgi:hypothetical protein
MGKPILHSNVAEPIEVHQAFVQGQSKLANSFVKEITVTKCIPTFRAVTDSRKTIRTPLTRRQLSDLGLQKADLSHPP